MALEHYGLPGLPTIVRQALGEGLHWLTFKPNPGRPRHLPRGTVPVDVLDRVRFFLDKGELVAALGEVERLEGLSRVLIKDWEQSLRCRVESQQAAQVLKAHSILVNRQYI